MEPLCFALECWMLRAGALDIPTLQLSNIPTSLLHMRVDLLFEDRLRSGANLLVYHLATLDIENARDRSDAIIHGKVRILIHVNLADIYFSFVVL